MSIPAVSEATASSPVELEDAVGIGHGSAVQGQGFAGSAGGSKVDETISRIAPTTNVRIAFRIQGVVYLPRELVADHLHVDLLTHLEPKVADEVLIDPWF